MKRTARTVLALIALTVLPVACTTGEPTSKPTVEVTTPAADPEPAPEPVEESTGNRAFTKSSFDVAWGVYSKDDRDVMCSAVTMLTPGGAQELFADGVPDQGLVDWQYWTELVQAECDQR